MKKFTETEVLDMIRKEVQRTSGREMAKKLDIHPSFVTDIVKGRRGLSDHVARQFGFEREVRFKRIA